MPCNRLVQKIYLVQASVYEQQQKICKCHGVVQLHLFQMKFQVHSHTCPCSSAHCEQWCCTCSPTLRPPEFSCVLLISYNITMPDIELNIFFPDACKFYDLSVDVNIRLTCLWTELVKQTTLAKSESEEIFSNQNFLSLCLRILTRSHCCSHEVCTWLWMCYKLSCLPHTTHNSKHMIHCWWILHPFTDIQHNYVDPPSMLAAFIQNQSNWLHTIEFPDFLWLPL